MIEELKTLTLKNGLEVANFSSPHPFTFTDGSILPAVSDELAKLTMLKATETQVTDKRRKGIRTIQIDFALTDAVMELIVWWTTFHETGKVDIVLVPLPVMTALHKKFTVKELTRMPFRTIRVADRITKEIYTDKFCI